MQIQTVILQRDSESIPWGFRIQGGADYKEPLSVKKVSHNKK